MPMTDFRLLVDALIDDNNFHFTGTGPEYKAGELSFPGTGIKIIGDSGLNSNPNTNEWYAMRMSNVWMGVDGVNDKDEFDFWYSKDDRDHKLDIQFKRGWQIGTPEEVVELVI
jgi:hypothetical protein